MHHTNHTFHASWDAPIDEVRVLYRFTPGATPTGPSFNDPGDPGWPDEIEIAFVSLRHGTGWHDAPWLAVWAEKPFREDLCELARAERGEMRAEARAAAREAA